ncbi:MAG: Gfo/Idh/MocA family oxidoreductase [Acidobacteria bacterium]|nr:Gfo/Idh/MocA family oxidoreductase [Acidobacteriota bacterium]
MQKIKTAVIGAGFMGRVHSEAIRRLGNVEIVAVAAVSRQEADAFGKAIGVERTTDDYTSITGDPEIPLCTTLFPRPPWKPARLFSAKSR